MATRGTDPHMNLGRVLIVWLTLATGVVAASPASNDPLRDFRLPEAAQSAFWNSPSAKAARKLPLKDLAALVPTQAGLKFCRCPKCDVEDYGASLTWSAEAPKVIKCQRCSTTFPNDTFPGKVDGKLPSETIEVRKGVAHTYPYHLVDPLKQRYPEERLYLEAKRDYEAREFLAKLALYAAIKNRDAKGPEHDPWLAKAATTLILRLAQVYPDYALHFDQPGQPKQFEPAFRPPPYRRAYHTAKWDWSGSQEVSIQLAIAYQLLRDDPAMEEAGKLLEDPNPRKSIEEKLFRPAAEFLANQPEEVSEMAFQAHRGLHVAGMVLKDPNLLALADQRLQRLGEQGFYYDGTWRTGDAAAQRRIVTLLDAWFARKDSTKDPLPLIGLARSAGATLALDDNAPKEILQAGLNPATRQVPRVAPSLLGGAGIARLGVGQGADALDLELRGMASGGLGRFRRQSLRMAVGGRAVLNDLDDAPERMDGWDRASASHNTVLVDGLNQLEALPNARGYTPGGDFRFFAVDPDFQVAVLDDPRSYPQSASRYRQTVVVSAGARSRYAVSVFDVRGGLQHDQIFHGPAGGGTLTPPAPLEIGPTSLLPPTIPFLQATHPDHGRWFVQSYGHFRPAGQVRLDHGSAAAFLSPGGEGVRLHILGDLPAQFIAAQTPPAYDTGPGTKDRPAFVLRRRSEDGSGLNSLFVTVFEPVGGPAPLIRVGRVASARGTVAVVVETADGTEHLIINLDPGTPRTVRLADGRTVVTDSVVARLRADGLAIAGGNQASCGALAISHTQAHGRILATGRISERGARGWFETADAVAAGKALIGRTLQIRHSDGTSHGWTISDVEARDEGRTRFYVREDPGFALPGGDSGPATYSHFPRTSSPGPHRFKVDQVARTPPTGQG